jgi:hypothetical protein
LEEIAFLKYKQRIIERLTEAIEPDTEAGEPPILPVIERFRPIGSTSEVLFRTVRPCVGTTKSHISPVVLDAPKMKQEGGVSVPALWGYPASKQGRRLCSKSLSPKPPLKWRSAVTKPAYAGWSVVRAGGLRRLSPRF